jgi:hypothetical protein
VHSDSLNGLWPHSRVGGRMAIMMGGAAKELKRDLKRMELVRIVAAGGMMQLLRQEAEAASKMINN